eukprot:scaffold101366_cov15-Prasinocladus_malaysianus.AAC.1
MRGNGMKRNEIKRKELKGKERKGNKTRRKGMEWNGMEWNGMKGKERRERKGKERKGKERKGKERKFCQRRIATTSKGIGTSATRSCIVFGGAANWTKQIQLTYYEAMQIFTMSSFIQNMSAKLIAPCTDSPD